MSNILKVTTPAGGYDNTNNVRVNPEMKNPVNVQGPADPKKVLRPDARSDSAMRQEAGDMQFKFETNFETFVQQLKESPVLAEELPALFGEYKELLAKPEAGKGMAEKIARFLTMIEREPGSLPEFVKLQAKTAVRFSGAFFDLLRRVMDETKSPELKNGVLDFLKHYTDMAESGFILKDIQRDIRQILKRMFPQQREQAAEIAKGMAYGESARGHGPENLKILKSSLLPFLTGYISETRDRGEVRNLTAHLAEQVSRYESGQAEAVRQSFEKLLSYPLFRRQFEGFDISRLFEVLSGTEFEKLSGKNREMEQLADILCRGAAGEAGEKSRAAFSGLLKAFLLNESVYMPLLHTLVPLSLGGRMMFSEMWIDPDSGEGRRREDGTRERTVRGLIKFDIQDLGFFDLFFLLDKDKVTLQLNVPEKLGADSDRIRTDVERILRERSLSAEELVIGKSDVPIPLTEAFVNLKERNRSVNVSI